MQKDHICNISYAGPLAKATIQMQWLIPVDGKASRGLYMSRAQTAYKAGYCEHCPSLVTSTRGGMGGWGSYRWTCIYVIIQTVRYRHSCYNTQVGIFHECPHADATYARTHGTRLPDTATNLGSGYSLIDSGTVTSPRYLALAFSLFSYLLLPHSPIACPSRCSTVHPNNFVLSFFLNFKQNAESELGVQTTRWPISTHTGN